jgi:uncharacterized membrane protein YbhN (UPF0104 family)
MTKYQIVRRIVSGTIVAGFLGWAVWYAYSNAESFSRLAEVSWTDGAILISAFLAIMVCNGIFILIVTEAFQIRLHSQEWLSLSFASSFANYFLPFKGGAGMRALYMYRLHGFPITEFVSTLSIMYLMHIVVNGILALIGMMLIVANEGPANISLLIFFAVISMFGILVMAIDIKIGTDYQKFPMAQFSRLLTAWRRVRQNRILVFKLWVLMLALSLATVWQCHAAFEAASISLPWEGVIVYAASKNMAGLVGLTPGSLGIVELISIYLGSVLGYGTADALVVQGLIRAVAVVVLLLVGPVALIYLRRRLRSASASISDRQVV